MKKGFTLIELLVVIAIISMLSTLSVVALNSARQKARDARRLSDIKQIRTALDMYFDVAQSYPANPATTTLGVASTTCISSTNGISSTCAGVTFMQLVPKDPQAAKSYVYGQQSSGASYTIVYNLENGGVATATPDTLGYGN